MEWGECVRSRALPCKWHCKSRRKNRTGQMKAACGFQPLLMRLLETIAHCRDSGRWDLMYRLAFRAARYNARLLEDAADPEVRRAFLMERAIRRDCHKMHAFVRFREVEGIDGGKSYFAWFVPEHPILRRVASFFVKRFTTMSWTIATPDGAAVWDQEKLRFIDTASAGVQPLADSQEDLWRTYYRSICNVARINPTAMTREMPQRYWRHLPEAAEIASLVRDGLSNFDVRHSDAETQVFSSAKAVQRALARLPVEGEGPQACRRCDLWRHATQVVAGEGPSSAQIMLVGEQPGDEEDLRGVPFIGPAGVVLNAAIVSAGLNRKDLYITNSVKHFKWKPRGKRRIHSKPGIAEINACNVWLVNEIATIRPTVIVALGATALRALVGTAESIHTSRQIELRHSKGARVLATYHPSAILRAEGDVAATMRRDLVADLLKAKQFCGKSVREG